MENGLAGLRKRLEAAALLDSRALLVDGELDDREHTGDNFGSVLEPNGEVVLLGLSGKELDEADRVGLSDSELAVVSVILPVA